MPLPSLDKTWIFDTNNTVPADGTVNPNDGENPTNDRKQMMLEIKNSLVASGFWSIKSSSDSTTADNTDNWSTIADLVWILNTALPAAHSWIVFQNTVLDIEICFDLIDLSSNDGGQWDVLVSRPTLSGSGGFSGGTTTARPTATDEVYHYEVVENNNGLGWGENDLTGRDWVWNTWVSNDGECTRVAILWSNELRGFWIIDRMKSPVTGMPSPEVFFKIKSSRGWTTSPFEATYTDLHDNVGEVQASFYQGTTPFKVKSNANGTDRMPLLYMTSESFANDACGQHFTAANQVDSAFGFFPIGLASLQPGFIGRHGEVFDLWWGNENNSTGDNYPGDASRQFVQMGDLILPWDGSVPTLA